MDNNAFGEAVDVQTGFVGVKDVKLGSDIYLCGKGPLH